MRLAFYGGFQSVPKLVAIGGSDHKLFEQPRLAADNQSSMAGVPSVAPIFCPASPSFGNGFDVGEVDFPEGNAEPSDF